MNIFFKIDGEVVTPSVNGSILEGITRKSIIELLKHWDMPVTERRISMEEIKASLFRRQTRRGIWNRYSCSYFSNWRTILE